MRIGENIAIYRKKRKLTQEQFGKMIGVSNQAVSKWENGQSLPDVLLLPEIAKALGISLPQLYGLDSEEPVIDRVCADDYPAHANDLLFDSFFHAAGCRFASAADHTEKEQLRYQKAELKMGKRLGCISNEAGAVILTDGFAFVDGEFKKDGDPFDSMGSQAVLRVLSDLRVRKVLAFGYRECFKRDKNSSSKFTLDEFAEGCALSSEDAAEALQSLLSIKVVSFDRNQRGEVNYSFSFMKLLYAFEIHRLAQMLQDDEVWLVVRDTNMILDYAFDKLWKPERRE